MRGLFRVMLVVFVLLLVVLGAPVLAQDGTETVVPDGTQVAVGDPLVEPTAPDVTQISINVALVIVGLLTAFAAGGVAGIAGMASYVQRVRNDEGTVIAMEKLAESFPASTLGLINDLAEGTRQLALLVKEVTDGVPVDEKGNNFPPGEPTADSPIG